jgi:hypothetical protein
MVEGVWFIHFYNHRTSHLGCQWFRFYGCRNGQSKHPNLPEAQAVAKGAFWWAGRVIGMVLPEMVSVYLYGKDSLHTTQSVGRWWVQQLWAVGGDEP